MGEMKKEIRYICLLYICFPATKDHSIIYTGGECRSFCNSQKAKMEETKGESENRGKERERERDSNIKYKIEGVEPLS